MKKLLILISVYTLAFGATNNLSAQRTWFGVGFGYKDLYEPVTSYYDMQTGKSFTGHSTGRLVYPGLYLSHYSSPRRGINLSLNPVTSYKYCFTSTDGGDYNMQKASGISMGFGLFGLIASDYQSKIEVHMCNQFSMGFLNGDVSENFYMLDIVGLSARYRISRHMKVSADVYPLSIYSGNYSASLGLNGAVRFLYSPR